MNNILFVIVIYRIRKEQSVAWNQLNALLGEDADNIHVHDNTDNNVYLAKAYNEAADVARKRGMKWIVILDSDTQITADYIDCIKKKAIGEDDKVYCPILVNAEGGMLSPKKQYGIPIAFNSGMMIPIRVIDKTGGFNEQYPLDYLDYWFCYKLRELKIDLVPLDINITHCLSLMDYDTLPLWRYQSILKAEKQFAIETGNTNRYRIYLIGRLVKWLITGHAYTKETFKALISI